MAVFLAWISCGLRVGAVAVFACLAGWARAEPLLLDARPAIAAWPAVTVLLDPGAELEVEALARQAERFTAPAGTRANLGRAAQTAWLRFPVQVPPGAPARRVLEIDYPALNRVDVWVLSGGRLHSQQRLGNSLKLGQRPLPSRTHAMALDLPPGDHEVLMRVHTLSSLVLPITLRSHESFTAYESQVQLVQGMVVGLALCMLLYSLAHWVGLRDRLFLDYALLLAGNTVFTLSYFGIGAQYLWPEWPSLSMQIAPMAIMVAVAAGSRFIRCALAVDEINRTVAVILKLAGLAGAVGLVATLVGLLDYRAAQALVTALGLIITCVVLPVAFVRARRGERVAVYMLVGWAFYTAGALTTAGLLRGYIEPSFLTQHIYPLSTMVEMAAWMAVLGLRVQALHRSADRARVETETLRALAHTDALTGLPNRRGLQIQLQQQLASSGPDKLLAVFLMDLDGFKAINDRHGHDVGDALLVAVGQRLRAHLRGRDVVARLGGDEFVVLAAGLSDERSAQAVGQKLLAALAAPIHVGGLSCEVGLTAGYAVAPVDTSDGAELLRRADAAMYAGKQAGRRRVQRGGPAQLASA